MLIKLWLCSQTQGFWLRNQPLFMTFDSQSMSEHPRLNCHIRTIKLSHLPCVYMCLLYIFTQGYPKFRSQLLHSSISTTDKSLLARTSSSPALWNCLVTQRQLLPWANEHGVRCPLNKLQMPSKETCSAPVFVATGSCLPGLRLTFSLVTIKSLVKDNTWKELEWPRRPGSQGETIWANVQCIQCLL